MAMKILPQKICCTLLPCSHSRQVSPTLSCGNLKGVCLLSCCLKTLQSYLRIILDNICVQQMAQWQLQQHWVPRFN